MVISLFPKKTTTSNYPGRSLFFIVLKTLLFVWLIWQLAQLFIQFRQ